MLSYLLPTIAAIFLVALLGFYVQGGIPAIA